MITPAHEALIKLSEQDKPFKHRSWDSQLPNGLTWDSWKRTVEEFDSTARKLRLMIHSGYEAYKLLEEASTSTIKAKNKFRDEWLERRKYAVEALQKGEDPGEAAHRRSRSDRDIQDELDHMQRRVQASKFK